MQWIVNAYLLTLAAFVALGGRVGDLVGNGRAFKLGAVVFVLASAACGFAGSEAAIIAARAVQGLGAALLTPATGALVANAFGAEERGRAMGIYAGVSLVFLALGPLLGGLLTDLVSWRAVFFVNLPVGALLLAAAHLSLPRAPGRPGRVDWGGVPLIVLSLGALVLALMQSRAWGWTAPATLTLPGGRRRRPAADGLVGAAPARAARRAAAVPLREPQRRRGRARGRPVLDDRRRRARRDLGPGRARLHRDRGRPLAAAADAAAAGDRAARRCALRPHRPARPVTLGCVLGAAALTWVALVLHHRSYRWLVPGYVVMGVGLGIMMTPANTDAMNAVPPALRAQASALLQTIRQVGATLGVAVMGTVVAHGQSRRIGELFEHRYGVPPRDVQQIEHALDGVQSSGATDRGLPARVLALISPLLDAVTAAVASAFGVAAAVLAVAAIVAAALLRHRPATDAAPASDAGGAQPSTSPRSSAKA